MKKQHTSQTTNEEYAQDFNVECISGPDDGERRVYRNPMPTTAEQVAHFFHKVRGGQWVATIAAGDQEIT